MIVVNWSTSQSQMQMKFKRISVERSKYFSICEILNHNIHSFNFRYELYCAEILLAGVMKQVIKRELLDLRPFKNYLILLMQENSHHGSMRVIVVCMLKIG